MITISFVYVRVKSSVVFTGELDLIVIGDVFIGANVCDSGSRVHCIR